MPYFDSSKIIKKYWYWKGNILRLGYSNQRGFWLSTGNHLVRCDAEGNILSPDKFLFATSNEATMEYPEYISSGCWLWRDINSGTYPDFDKYNAERKHDYLTKDYSDEIVSAKLLKEHNDSIKKLEYYNGLSDFEKKLYNFDWYYEYTDDSSVYKSARKELISFIPELTKMSVDEANALIKRFKPAACGIDMKYILSLK